jgi:hypothetical protein
MQHLRPGIVSDYYSLSGRTCAEMSDQELIRPLSKPSIVHLDLERTVSAIKPVPEILKDLDTACALLEANALMEDPASEKAVALRMFKGQIEMAVQLFAK